MKIEIDIEETVERRLSQMSETVVRAIVSELQNVSDTAISIYRSDMRGAKGTGNSAAGTTTRTTYSGDMIESVIEPITASAAQRMRQMQVGTNMRVKTRQGRAALQAGRSPARSSTGRVPARRMNSQFMRQ